LEYVLGGSTDAALDWMVDGTILVGKTNWHLLPFICFFSTFQGDNPSLDATAREIGQK
jgi:hypothetical protein